MPVVAAVGGILGGLGALGSLFGGIFGGSAKKDAAYAGAALTDQQAEFTRQQTDEQVRRFNLEADQVEGHAYAAVGASGFAPGGSMTKYADALAKEFNLEAAWMQKAGYTTSRFQHQAASVQRQAADAGLFGDVLGGVSGFLGGAGQAVKALGGG
jgi:hypothetical protein